ncbi:LysM peptidoglycan-binding domain-containing protein [Streptomyces sasae]|uniref:LysM peptidoglycan-binding domain-containing protein n=1 Tax=Streptomyces sasae TaxID=1266772 RepID=UPI00292DCEA0|nr:LysM peptidoglycan-binding domain-containing protein [Streptomyces sasae]
MAHRTPKPLRAAGALLRALTGLILLIALVGGVPITLLAIGHQPTELSGGLNLLLQQDDGTLWLVALTLIGWAAWAAFTFSVMVEVIAVARRRSAPRLRGLGSIQSLASFLVGAIVLLAPTAASAATTTPAVAITQTAGTTTATPTSSPAAPTSYPTHTVTSATETPWDLAEQYLGNGQRWRDIAALNPDIPELASGDQYLPPNAVIKLPLDARPVTPASATSTPSPTTTTADDGTDTATPHATTASATSSARSSTDDTRTHTAPDHDEVTVAAGDSLWSIADKEYGDPTAWRDIYDANKGEAQPGGGRFTNPDLIFPGQQLDLPRTNGSSGTPDQPGPGRAAPTRPHHDQSAAPEAEQPTSASGSQDTGQDEQQAPATSAPAAPSSPATDPTSAPAPTDTSSPAPTTSPAAAAPRETTDPASTTVFWTATGIVAAALAGTLAVRRRRQQHRRRPGRRIAMPTGRTAATEQSMRSVQTPSGFDLLNAALRSLAAHVQTAGGELPTLNAVVLHENRVDLHLAAPASPLGPFTATADHQDLWTCSANHPDLADTTALDAVAAPYPALVSIGWDLQGHYVLIDLEHVGLLHLGGDADFARHVLHAIAVELANTPVAGHLTLTALGHAVAGLETAVPERVRRAEDLTDATAELLAHATDQRAALTDLGVRTPHAARLLDDTAGDWTPHIVVADHLPDGPVTDDLLTALSGQPRTASAVVTAQTGTSIPDGSWDLACQDPQSPIALPHSGLLVRLQALDDDCFRDAIDLLTTADTDADVPAEGLYAEEAPLDELPDEYAELEREALTDDTNGVGRITPAPSPMDTGGQPVPSGTAPGQSLADVLALADEETDSDASTVPATGPAGAGLPHSTPCTVATASVSVSIPTPTAPQADTAPAPGEPRAEVLADTSADIAPATSTHRPDSATPPTPSAPGPAATAAPGPSVLLLGPLTVEGAKGRVDSNRRSVATELLAFLAVNPGSDHHAVDGALWPNSRVNKEMRNAVISRARSWLGTDDNGNHHLPRVQNTPDKRYRLGTRVTCDWTTFQQHALQGLADTSEDGDLALRQALALLRGRPFSGMDPQRYAWAEPIIQEMVSAITDVAFELSTRRREAGDSTGALWAARQGLLAVDDSETLYRALFLAHHAAGDTDALREAAARLRSINDSLGSVDMEPDTAELLRNLLPQPARTR